MDVQSLANDRRANQVEAGRPLAEIPKGFQSTDHEDLLFADKETSVKSFRDWTGPKIYETGASDIELVHDKPEHALEPTIWTSGVGSLLRTAVAVAGCLPAKFNPETLDEVLEKLETHKDIRTLIACDGDRELQRRYPAKLMSFEMTPWWEDWADTGRRVESGGFTYQDELDYGRWLQRSWWAAGECLLHLLHGRDLLGKQHSILGRGILTTIHEGGLMGAWEIGEQRILIRIIMTQDIMDLHSEKEKQEVEQNKDAPSRQRIIHNVVCETLTLDPDDSSQNDRREMKVVIEPENETSNVYTLCIHTEHAEKKLTLAKMRAGTH